MTQSSDYSPGQPVQVSTSPAGGWTPAIVRPPRAAGRITVHVPTLGVVVDAHMDKVRPARPALRRGE